MIFARRESSPPRILYLAFYFPPSRASGVYRARATANHLAAQGWDVTVCAAPMSFLHDVTGSVDEELASTVDRRIIVERPRLNQFAWEKDLRNYSRFRARLPQVANRLYRFNQRKLFPENYASWGRSVVARGLRLHTKRRFDVVLATGNPFASFAAAWAFHRLTGVPYVVDYRDSWTLDLFNDRPAFPDDHLAWRWERRVLSRAAGAVFVNEPLRRWHAERYPDVADRMLVVPNGWDADLVSPAGEAGVDPGITSRPLRFGYLGTLTNSQPVEELAAAWAKARTFPELAEAELNIYGHLGFFKAGKRELASRIGLNLDPDGQVTDAPALPDRGIHYRGPVSKTEIASVYEHNDVLVFLAGGGRYVTSGKIFEYMASGKPIVSVHAPGIAAQDVLDGYPLWFNADSLDAEAVANSMVEAGKVARGLTAEQRAAACRHAQGFTRDNLLAALEERLRGIAGREQIAVSGLPA